MSEAIASDRVVITPQPRNGRPFRFEEGTKGQGEGDWFNENIGYRHGRGPMLFRWRCPFGKDGEPQLIDNIWYWVNTKQPKAFLDQDNNVSF